MNKNTDSKNMRSSKPRRVERIGISGDFLDGVDLITSTSMTLLICPGRVEHDEREIMVPFVSLGMVGSKQGLNDDGDSEKLFSRLLSLENATYLGCDIIAELSFVLESLVQLSAGPVKPNLVGMYSMKTFLQDAREKIDASLGALEEITISSN